MARDGGASCRIPDCDAYFDEIQARKKLPVSLQQTLTSAFARIPASSFPYVPGGKVIEIPADTTIVDAVRILSGSKIMAAPMINPEAESSLDWRERYMGIVDYSAIVLWVLENAELASVALSVGSATVAGVGSGAAGALCALATGLTELPAGAAATTGFAAATVTGFASATTGAAVAGGLAAEKVSGKGAPSAGGHLGDDFYKVLIQEEPFKSTTVQSITKSFRWAPFLPVALDSSMLTVLLLLSKYRLRNVPVIEAGKPSIRNFITQSAVIKGLEQCKGRDWFDCISALTLADFGLPFMSYEEVICVKNDELIFNAFKHMKDNRIGGLPVIEGPSRKFVGSVSIRDIRFLLLKPQLFSNFRHLKVKVFMETVASLGPENGELPVTPPVTCAPNATLGSIIDSLASSGGHRIYVVEGEEQEVVGVVTLRDVISCFITEPPNHFDNYYGFSMKEILRD